MLHCKGCCGLVCFRIALQAITGYPIAGEACPPPFRFCRRMTRIKHSRCAAPVMAHETGYDRYRIRSVRSHWKTVTIHRIRSPHAPVREWKTESSAPPLSVYSTTHYRSIQPTFSANLSKSSPVSRSAARRRFAAAGGRAFPPRHGPAPCPVRRSASLTAGAPGRSARMSGSQ